MATISETIMSYQGPLPGRLIVFSLLLISVPGFGQRKSGSTLDHLSPEIEILAHFGERADISPDNQRIAFMDESYGKFSAI